MDTASRLVEDMTQTGVDLSRITCSTIIKGYCIKGDMELALAGFQSIGEHNEDRQSGTSPSPLGRVQRRWLGTQRSPLARKWTASRLQLRWWMS